MSNVTVTNLCWLWRELEVLWNRACRLMGLQKEASRHLRPQRVRRVNRERMSHHCPGFLSQVSKMNVICARAGMNTLAQWVQMTESGYETLGVVEGQNLRARRPTNSVHDRICD